MVSDKDLDLARGKERLRGENRILKEGRWSVCRPPQTTSQCAKLVVSMIHKKERGRHPMDTAIGVDLAESAFQLPGATMTGEVKLRKSSRVCSF